MYSGISLLWILLGTQFNSEKCPWVVVTKVVFVRYVHLGGALNVVP